MDGLVNLLIPCNETELTQPGKSEDRNEVNLWNKPRTWNELIAHIRTRLIGQATVNGPLRPGDFALMRLFILRTPGEFLAIAGGVQIGIPRFAEGNLALLPKMTQVTRRHTQDLASLITPQPLRVVGI